MELRCPLCRGALAPEEPRSACAACGTAYHADCVAELGVGCATLGCSAAGAKAPVVAAGPPSPLWPLVFTWVLFVVFWPAGLFTWAWAVARARVHPRLRLAAALLASPFVVVPLCTVVDAVQGYVRGTAVVAVPLERWLNSTGVDPLVRCEEQLARFAAGPDLLSRGTNELVLHDLARAFGPMRGGYAGPIPTAAEARAAFLEAGSTPTPLSVEVEVDPPIGDDGRGLLLVTVGGRRGPSAVALDLSGQLCWRATSSWSWSGQPVRVAWLDDRAFLLAIDEVGLEEALLCDLTTRRVWALLSLRSEERPLDR